MKRFATVLAMLVAGCGSNPANDPAGAQPVAMQEATNDAQQRAKVHTELGRTYLREGLLNVALDEARIALDADSSYSLAHNLLGLVHMALREDDAAEQAFLRALRLAPTDPEINNNYGWFLCQVGRERQSIPYFVQASKNSLYGQPTKPLTNAGICAINMRDMKGAEEFLLRALRADAANTDAVFLLAEVYYRLGRLEEARKRISDLHRMMEPSAESTWLGLRVERKLGDRESEARYASQLRRHFAASEAYQKMMQGQFE